MKKLGFLLSLSVLFFLMGCGKQELIQDVQQPQEETQTEKHVVRNVDRGMTVDEVKNAEKIKESDIVEESNEGGIFVIETTTYLNGKELYLLYAFYDGKLGYVMYGLDNAKYSDYWSFRKILGNKYGSGEDIDEDQYNKTKEESDVILKEIKEAQQKAQDCIDGKIQCSESELNQAVQKGKDKIKELDERKMILSKYMFDDDQVRIGTKPNYEYDKDLQITLGDLRYSHQRELEDGTFISIDLRTGIETYGATLVISYVSKEIKEFFYDSNQSDIENNL